MTERPFFTRSEKLAFLRKLIEENSDRSYRLVDSNLLFKAVDAYCAEHLHAEDRGGWFAPLLVGGTPLKHTPPHIIFATYAIYADLATGGVPPMPHLGGPLDLHGATAVQLAPEEGFQLIGRDGEATGMTDVLAVIPARIPGTWLEDYYGFPQPLPGFTAIGWHAAGATNFTALCSGILLLHGPSRTVVNPLAIISPDQERELFTRPLTPSRLERCRERLEAFLHFPLAALEANHDTAKRFVEAYLERFPGWP